MTASRCVAAAVVVATLLAAPRARADASTADQTIAQSLFDAAVKLMEQGHFAEACPKLAESQRLDPGGGTLLNLGFCRENEGKLASAWAAYNEALSQAIRDGRHDRQATAQVHVDELDAKVAKLAIDLSDAAKRTPGIEIRLDGAPVRQAAWSVLTPIDKGEHEIVVTAPRKREYKADVVVQRDGTVQRVSIPGLADAPVEIAQGGGERRARGQAVIGWVTAGVGVALAGAGAITGGLAIDAHGTSNAECGSSPPYHCTADGAAAVSRAQTFAWLSDFGMGLGAAGIVTGVVLVLTAPRSAARVVVAPVAGAHGAGAAMSLTF